MKYDVFISYSRKDLNLVEKFVKDLMARIPNLTYWFDLTGIESAEAEFDEKIIKAIDNSSYVVYFLSPNSMKSRWTKEEVMYAKNCGKKVIPVLLNGVTLEGWFLFHFGRVDCIDLSKKEQVNKFIKKLSGWTKKEISLGEDENSNANIWSRFVKSIVTYKYKSSILKVLLYLLSFIIFFFLFCYLISKCDDGITDSPSIADSVDSVTTEVVEDCTENSHDYVDLGLSVKWATCNVGAESPEVYGDYFAWGETQPKSTYDWNTYKLFEGDSDNLTKYCTISSYGTVDNKAQLDLSDDAARANWGGSWRMPTHDELTELRKKCSWTWTTQNGVEGYKVTSKTNGNSIFLPAAGYRDNSILNDAGSSDYYWSSSLNTVTPLDARYVSVNSSSVGWDYCSRYYGLSVRPVCP